MRDFIKHIKHKVVAMQGRACIVGGNAPSLATIDYARLPLVYDTLRCNQFYMEDRYYLGRDVKAVGFATQMLFEQIYTMLNLKRNAEYNIESIFISKHHIEPMNERDKELDKLAEVFNHQNFIHTLHNGKYSHNIEAFLEYLKLEQIYFYKHPTTAIKLCGIAIAMGYRDIYLAGIDFYEGKTYVFDTLQDNIVNLMPGLPYIISQEGIPRDADVLHWHTKQADLDALEFLSKHYSVRFYSLCPDSPMTQYIPLAPITNNTFTPEVKPLDYTKDVMIPPEYARKSLNLTPPPPRCLSERNKQMIAVQAKAKRNRIKTNIYYKLFCDILRLPSDIRHYFNKG